MIIQVARPVADELTGGWSPTPLYERLQGQVPNTGNPIGSSANPQGDAFKVQLHGLAWPKLPGPVVLTVGLAGDGSTPATVVLLEGERVIAATRVTPPSSFQNYTLTLTDAQVGQISNYADLHAEVIAGDVKVVCCPNLLPALLQATVTGGGSISGSYPLLWNTLIWSYTGPFGTCGVPLPGIVLTLICNGAGWSLNTLLGGSYVPASSRCAPLSLTFTGVDLSGCGGSNNATITVTP